MNDIAINSKCQLKTRFASHICSRISVSYEQHIYAFVDYLFSRKICMIHHHLGNKLVMQTVKV